MFKRALVAQWKRVAQAVQKTLHQLAGKTFETAEEPAWMQTAAGAGQGDQLQFDIDSVVGLMEAIVDVQTPQITDRIFRGPFLVIGIFLVGMRNFRYVSGPARDGRSGWIGGLIKSGQLGVQHDGRNLALGETQERVEMVSIAFDQLGFDNLLLEIILVIGKVEQEVFAERDSMVSRSTKMSAIQSCSSPSGISISWS